MKSRNPIIVIAGPTASGKSDTAIDLAKRIHGFVINADSRQIYKEMVIGTAQPVPERIQGNAWVIKGVKHFLYGYKTPEETSNIATYQKAVQEIFDTEEGIPILVGGTGLYIDCIVNNYKLREESVDNEIREKLSKLDTKHLQKLLDTDILSTMNESDRENPRRLIRMIEKEDKDKLSGRPLRNIYFVMDVPKEELTQRIKTRVYLMFKNGLEKEVENLFKKYNSALTSFNTIGYQEFREYFKNQKSITAVKEEIVLHTLQYAKRQRTWFRRNKNAIWIEDKEDIFQQAEQFVTMS